MNKSIILFAQLLSNELTNTGRHSTARLYDRSVRSLLQFTGDEKLSFSDLNRSLLKEYEKYLLNKRWTRNKVSLYLRMIRSICYRADSRLDIIIEENLFSDVGQTEENHQEFPVVVIRNSSNADLSKAKEPDTNPS